MVTKCPKCDHDNPPGMRLCRHCAAELTQLCARCGFVNPGGMRFCGNCGQPLFGLLPTSTSDQRVLQHMHSYVPKYLLDKIAHTQRTLQGERRNVTVLSTDISDFTELTHKTAPEKVYDVINECLRIQVEEIYRYGGMVDKFTGDGLQAIFGAPLAHENDAERAVRAALSAKRAIARFNDALMGRTGTGLKVRMGLHAGPVVVGGVGSDLHLEYTAVGDAINVASLIERIAPPNSILVSSQVYRQIDTLFRFRKLGSILIKGQAVYEVLGPAPRPRQRAWMGRQPAPLVGRQKELERLRRLVDRVVEEGRGQIIHISAEAGGGKSRLSEEMKLYLRSKGFVILENAFLSYAQGLSYLTFLTLLREHFHLPRANEARVKEKMSQTQAVSAQRLEDIIPCQVTLESASIAGVNSDHQIDELPPAELRQRTFLALWNLFVGETKRNPVAFIMEDFQEVDQPSLDLLLFLLGLVERAPVLFCCLARSEEDGRHRQMCQMTARAHPSRYHELQLGPLSREESRELVTRLLHLPDLPASLEQAVLDRAGGNPLFIIETLSELIERGIIRQKEDRTWLVPDVVPQGLGVPRSLQGLILSRFDGLDDRLRSLLRCASVLGPTFSANVLSDVVDGEENVVAGLEELVHHGTLLRTSTDESPTYAFRHIYAQEMIYDTLLTTTRQVLHRKAGQALAARADDTDEYIELLAYHYARSDAPDEGIKYLTLAAERAAARNAAEKAAWYYSQAESLLEKTLAGRMVAVGQRGE